MQSAFSSQYEITQLVQSYYRYHLSRGQWALGTHSYMVLGTFIAEQESG